VSAIEIRGLVKRYGVDASNAVDGIDLDVAEGELFGLLGPNGAGKTTTVGIATTRVRPTAGTVGVFGVDVAHDPVLVRQTIGVVTQFNTLDRACSVRENLVYHCRYFGFGSLLARRRADELLDAFALADRADAKVGQLSGGMAQRLQVARAIAHRPKVLFLDEPTAGLDPQSRIALWDVLAELRTREGLTILLTTHHMEEADRMCERIAIMDHGRILVLDSPDALKRSVGADTIVDLRVDTVDEQLRAALAAVHGVHAVEPGEAGVRVLARGEDGLLARLVEASAGHGLRDVSVTEPTLETVFLRLTGRALRA
jgi:ABC-2 type transport system ATP-binding protein